MSKSAMLRTRRRDVNVKPNRRLDRKSSRGMIYENEELRLRTININAEIERGQSDIKKLRRENEQLRKEIWCLRDEYEKLDKLLKEKGENDSCTSCSSETDSCTSCSESEDNETTQNIENVQKTTLNNLRAEFDHLSVVTEETSAENSDKNSATSPQECTWDILPPDQSYPNSNTLPALPTEQTPKHFFSPIKPSKSFENCSHWPITGSSQQNWIKFPNFDQKHSPLIQKPVLPTCGTSTLGNCSKITSLQTCEKTTPDILVKTDLPSFTQESNRNSFVNGGNLDELLQDIETISQDILQISTQHDSNQKLTNTYVPNMKIDNFENGEEILKKSQERPYKSELNVVLMPQAMPLLGFDKYQNIKSSLESVVTLKKSSESLPMLEIPPPQPFPSDLLNFTPTPKPDTPIPPIPPITHPQPHPDATNPFFFYENFQNTEMLPNRYEMFAHDNFGFKSDLSPNNNNLVEDKDNKTDIKANIENEIVENKVGAKLENEDKQERGENEKNDCKKDKKDEKSPKSRRTRRVSIYFKGKKDKLARSLSLDTKIAQESQKNCLTNPKTSSSESKMSLTDGIPLKIPETSEKIVNSDTNKTSSDSKNSNYDRKHRKSSSTSPERKHTHVKLESDKKCHKKRHKKSERRLPQHRRSISGDRIRERSFSVCTDRSNILDHKFGHFEDFTNSERDRSNSLSSCETVKSRKMSAVPQFQVSGKIPWFGCWGNGCL